jgi:hypothetical protein
MCVVPRAPTDITIRGLMFQPHSLMSSIRGWYLLILVLILSLGCLLLVYVNPINCIVREGSIVRGGRLRYGRP